ncbi:MAG TPA: hypothetical protein VFR38_16220 [Gaiellaceae bacterium]|nr:hypothetical protein [Gaiellaceae bacterium]
MALRSAGRIIPAIPVPGFDRSKQFWNGRATLLLGFVPGGVERYFVPRPGTEAKARGLRHRDARTGDGLSLRRQLGPRKGQP